MTTIDFRERSEIAHATSCDVEELLERSLEVAVLADVLASVTDTGRGRLVLVAGEAGIGKTALVRRVLRPAPGRVRVLSGACEALFTPRPLGPLLDIADGDRRRARGAGRGRRRPERGADRARCDELRAACADRRRARGPALGRRGDARRDPPARPPDRGGAARSSSPRYRDDELEPRPPAAGRARRARRSAAVDAARARAAVAWRRSRRSRGAARRRRATSCTRRTGRQPVLRHRGARRRAARGARHRPRRRAGPRRAPRRRRAGAARRGRRSCRRAAELWLLEALAGERLDHARGVSRLGDAACRAATRWPSATSSPASRSRSRCRRIAGWRCTARALAALARRVARRPDLARLAHHAEAAGDARGGAALRAAPRPRARPRSARTARRRPSTRARCVSPTRLPREERAELLERRSHECYLTDQIDEAIEARR